MFRSLNGLKCIVKSCGSEYDEHHNPTMIFFDAEAVAVSQIRFPTPEFSPQRCTSKGRDIPVPASARLPLLDRPARCRTARSEEFLPSRDVIWPNTPAKPRLRESPKAKSCRSFFTLRQPSLEPFCPRLRVDQPIERNREVGINRDVSAVDAAIRDIHPIWAG